MSFDDALFSRSNVVKALGEAPDTDEVEFAKAYEQLPDEVQEAYDTLAKHFLGSHDQEDHARKDHQTGAGAKAGGGLGAKMGGVAGGVGGALMGSKMLQGMSGNMQKSPGKSDPAALLLGALVGALGGGAAGAAGGGITGAQVGAFRGTGTTNKADAERRAKRSTALNLTGLGQVEALMQGAEMANAKSTDVSRVGQWMHNRNKKQG